MFKNIIVIFCLLSCCVYSQLTDEQAIEISNEWNSIKNEIYDGNDVAVRAVPAADRYRAFLEAKPQTRIQKNLHGQGGEELIDYTLALAWVNAGEYDKALLSLKREAANYDGSKARFLDNTRNPDSFTKDVFNLHSAIMAGTKKVSTIAGSGYETFDVSDKNAAPNYLFSYSTDEKHEDGVLLEGLDPGEDRQMLMLSGKDDSGKYSIIDQAEVVADHDKFTISLRRTGDNVYVVLGGVSKVIEYKGDFRVPVVHKSNVSNIALKISGGKIEQPLAALARVDAQRSDKSQERTSAGDQRMLTSSNQDAATDSTNRKINLIPIYSILSVVVLAIVAAFCRWRKIL